jgi:FkbM family methyltransferase
MNFWSSDAHQTGETAAIRLVGDRLSGKQPRTVFDVGANVGDYSEFCLRLLGPQWLVHAFEPSPTTFQLLSERLSSAPKNRLRCHMLGFSDSQRQTTLYSSGPGATIASVERLERPLREFKDEFSETIQLTTIDQFCAQNAIEKIDFLKLDVEGHEIAVLRGASRMLDEGRIRFLQFEFGENNISSRTYLRDFVELLGDRYSFFRIVPGGVVPWTYLGGASEIFATMNYLCEMRDKPQAG